MNRKKTILLGIITFFIMTISVFASEPIFDDICTKGGIRTSLRFVGYIVLAIKVLVPLIIIVMGTIDLTRAITSNDDSEIKKRSITLVKRIAVGVLIFFIPTIINIVFSWIYNFSDVENLYSDCLSCITDPANCEIPEPIANPNDIVSTLNLRFSKGSAETAVPDYSADVGSTKSFEKTTDYPNISPGRNKYGSFPYKDLKGRDIKIDPRWETANIVTLNVPCDHLTFSTVRVHRLAQPQFTAALTNICTLTSKGMNGIKLNSKDVKFGGAYVPRKTSAGGFSNHAWGLAIDFNYDWSIKIDNKNYKPYSGMGKLTKTAYDNFVSIIGSKEDPRNVNYVLWQYAFSPSGFKWGGNWSSTSFDPMHFEIDWKNTSTGGSGETIEGGGGGAGGGSSSGGGTRGGSSHSSGGRNF